MSDASTVEVQRAAGPLEPLWLTAVVEGHPGPRFLLAVGKATVGRASDNDVVVEDRTVFSRHLEVELAEGGVRVRDLGAKNPARFQGSAVTDAVLSAGLGAVRGRIGAAHRARGPGGGGGAGCAALAVPADVGGDRATRAARRHRRHRAGGGGDGDGQGSGRGRAPRTSK